jgi:hypothetical protein
MAGAIDTLPPVSAILFDLFRLCELFEHGDRHGPAFRLPLSAKLQLPVSRGVGHRVLAALPYVAVILVDAITCTSRWAATGAARYSSAAI